MESSYDKKNLCVAQDVTSVSVFTIGLERRVWIATTVRTTALSTIDMYASFLKV